MQQQYFQRRVMRALYSVQISYGAVLFFVKHQRKYQLSPGLSSNSLVMARSLIHIRRVTYSTIALGKRTYKTLPIIVTWV